MDINRFKQLLESKLGSVKPLLYEQGTTNVDNTQNTTNVDNKKENIKKYQIKLKNAGCYLGDSGPNKDGIDGIWGNKTQKAHLEYEKFGKCSTEKQEKVKEEKIKEQKFCPVISEKTTDIPDISDLLRVYKSYDAINRYMEIGRKIFTKQGFPQRIACELTLNKIRTKYQGKNLIIVDTLQKVLYVFDKDTNFIDKTQIISGYDKQSEDPKKIAQALLTWDEQALKLGFKYDSSKYTYVDITGKNRKYDPEIVYADTQKSGTRFLPKGIYTTGSNLGSDEEYAGNKDNMLYLRTLGKNGKEISQAIHGFYKEKPREVALRKAKELLSNPNDPKLTKEFLDAINTKQINLSKSYGCINVPEEFLPTLRKYMVNSYVFNIGETGDNYLVDNTENYFDKMLNYPGCPSPKSLGAEEPIKMA